MKEKELTLEYVRLANFDDETTEIFQEEFKQHFSLNKEKLLLIVVSYEY